MKEAIRVINLKPVDGYTPKMKRVKTTGEKYEVELELEEAPDALWAAIFREELEKSTPPDHLADSRSDTQLIEKSIMFFTSASQIEHDGKQIAELVDSVNARVKQENRKIEEENKREKGAEADDEAIMKRMREALKKII